MQRIDRVDFTERFPMMVPSRQVRGIQRGPILIERDTMISANIEGDVVIRNGAYALVFGIIDGSIEIEAGAVGYCDGIVKGNVTVGGAACIQDIVKGDVRVDPGATLALDAMVSGTLSEVAPRV